MKKVKEIFIKLNDWRFIILIILIIGGAFYWFSLRPYMTKKYCINKVMDVLAGEGSSKDDYNFGYNLCLHKKGL